MANLDKTSVRDEVSRLKADFEQLCAEGKITSESKLLMSSLFIIVELILSIFMEKVTKKNSKNSSKPPSQTDKDESSLADEGSHGKGKNEQSGSAKNTRVKESTTVVKVDRCDVCGEELTGTPCMHIETRTKIDIIFEKVVEHVEAEIKQCPNCNSIVKGRFPADMHGPLQYGDGLKAFVVNLLVCQRVALNRVQKLIKSMMGTVISESTLLKFVLRLHQALADWELQATEQILKMPVVYVDETSCYVPAYIGLNKLKYSIVF